MMIRVCHGFGVTHGIWVTGVMVTGAVSNFCNRDHTALSFYVLSNTSLQVIYIKITTSTTHEGHKNGAQGTR